MKRFLLTIALSLLYVAASAQPLVISDPDKAYNIFRNAEFLVADPNQVTIDSLLHHPEKYHFVAGQKPPFKPEGQKVYWFRVELKSQINSPLFIRAELPFIGSLPNLYVIADSKLISHYDLFLGAVDPKSLYKLGRRVWPLSLTPGQAYTLYLKTETNHSANYASLEPNERLLTSLHYEDLIYGLYYGFILIICLYSLLMFVRLRDWDNLIYLIWIILLGPLTIAYSGQYSQWPAINQMAISYLVPYGGIPAILHILFGISFMQLRQQAKGWYKASLISITLIGIGTLLDSYFIYTGQPNSELIGLLFGLLDLLCGVGAGVAIVRRGFGPAWYFILGTVLFYISPFTSTYLAIQGYPASFWLENANPIGCMTEMLFFTLGLTYKVNLLKKHQDEAVQEQLRLTQENQQLIETQNRVLEEKVEQRTAELRASQAQLIQKEKLASLGELTAGIAHEIQNPLNFVNNFSEVSAELIEEQKEALAKGDLEEAGFIANDLAQNLQKITHHGGRASAIVKGMLEHSKGGEGKKEPTDLVRLTQECFKIAYQGYRSKHRDFQCDLQTQFQADTVSVEVVTQDIGRVVINVLTNAFYSLRERSSQQPENYLPQVWIRITQQTAYAELRIKDNGTGIPQAIRAKIFQPFFTTKPTGEGTGLGLSLSYDIITKGHGGTMTVESQEGLGTEFIVRLPV